MTWLEEKVSSVVDGGCSGCGEHDNDGGCDVDGENEGRERGD